MAGFKLLSLTLLLVTIAVSNQLQSKIIGGKDVTINDFNWMAAVVMRNNPREIVCGAIFIKDRWLLSAAHCFRSQTDYMVRIGVRRLHDNSLPENQYTVSRIVVHPRYRFRENGDDLALIKVDRKIRTSNLIQPVPALDNGNHEWVSAPCYVAGWGNTKVNETLDKYRPIQEVQVPVVDSSSCHSKYASVSVKIHSGMICAGEKGKEVCLGDSGGSLMCNHGSSWFLVGVVSFGRRCGEIGFPSVYTRVSSYREFIEKTIRQY